MDAGERKRKLLKGADGDEKHKGGVEATRHAYNDILHADSLETERKAIDLFCVDFRGIAGERGGRRTPLRELCETAESPAALDVFLKTLVHVQDYTKICCKILWRFERGNYGIIYGQ